MASSRKYPLTAILTGIIINLSAWFPGPVKAETILGVVRSPLPTADWNSVESRLQSSRINYQTIDIDNLNSAEALRGLRVLFLPNVEVMTTDQIRILEQWVQQGGRLIASGTVGNRSTPLARERLRTLIGSYWAFPLSNPATPISQSDRCQDQICRNITEWAATVNTSGTVAGGVLIPATQESYTAGVWQGSSASAAAIATTQAIYLGWHWGRGESPEVDTAWLQAAINRYTGASSPPQSSVARQNHTIQPAPPRRLSESPTTIQTPPQQSNTGSRTTIQTPPPANRVSNPNLASVNPRPSLLQLFTDPSEQSAPAGLEVKPGNDPIDNTTAILMREELENLLGRFENAVIASASGSTPINLQIASAEPKNPVTTIARHATSSIPSRTQNAIALAQQAIKQFPELVAAQNWVAARRLWLDARQKLWENYPTDGERSGAEIRAVWLDRGTIVAARGEAGLAQIFDRLADAGINTVFFETVNAGYTIYPSRVAPSQNPLTVGWDPLAAAVKLAKARGMELHAWVWVFAIANQRHNALLRQPDSYLGPVLSAYPEWANLDNQGRTWHENDRKAYLDPANREVRSYLLRLVGEIAHNYQVDGIHLDYIRYPFQDANRNFNFGYGTASRTQFRDLTGVDPISLTPRDGVLWQQWTQFRSDQVTSFVRDVRQLLSTNYPNVILSAAVFPHPETERIAKIQQHWEVWARQGYLDLLVPMTYSLDTNRLQRITQPLTGPQQLGLTLIAPSVKLLDIPNVVAIDQIQALRDLPSGGYSIFAVETIDSNLQGFLRRTQNNGGNHSHIIPYRQPLKAASDRYLALKREWSFLLANDQLWIRESQLNSFRNQAEVLAQALQNLAESPNPQALSRAQRELATFQSQFNGYMTLHAREKPYQVQSWQNRLASLDMLLRYGAHRLN
ncbi:family 10 glycosylhydrolase [Limnospira fusiformis PMC 851.14]|uniref:Family 10 glycosylhydrolase n=1 Tax=Limnospira fusiformis PMC 851.14 TaxID=2219512 RepID=A0ABU9ELG2_LIMFS